VKHETNELIRIYLTEHSIPPGAHTHPETDITGLSVDLSAINTSLAGKEATANKGAANGYASLDGTTKIPISQIPTGSSSSTVAIGNDSRLSDARTPLAHSHPESDITNLVGDLAGKAASVHTHAESDVTNLVADLAGKAAASHTHPESDITGLTTDLANKSNIGHTHAESDVTGLVADLANKSNVGHTHAQTEITNLVDTLATKSDVAHRHTKTDISDFAHGHAMKEITGLVKALAAKQDVLPKPKPQVFNPLLTNYRMSR